MRGLGPTYRTADSSDKESAIRTISTFEMLGQREVLLPANAQYRFAQLVPRHPGQVLQGAEFAPRQVYGKDPL